MKSLKVGLVAIIIISSLGAYAGPIEETGGFLLFPKSANITSTLRQRIDGYVTTWGNNRTYKNLCGNTIVLSYNASVGTYEIRDDFYTSANVWYLTAIEEATKTFSSIQMTKKKFVDEFMKTYGADPRIAGNMFQVLWSNPQDPTLYETKWEESGEREFNNANATFYSQGSIISLESNSPRSREEYNKVMQPKIVNLGNGVRATCTDFFAEDQYPKRFFERGSK